MYNNIIVYYSMLHIAMYIVIISTELFENPIILFCKSAIYEKKEIIKNIGGCFKILSFKWMLKIRAVSYKYL